jgi:signal transduction histidine kinase
MVALYCALLLLLGTGFAFFTIQSFSHYVRQTTIRDVTARSAEIWHTAKNSLADNASLANLIEQRFAPEAQDRYIRIAQGRHILYESGIPPGTNLAALRVHGPLAQSDGDEFQFGSLIVSRSAFKDGRRTYTIDSGQSEEFAEGVERDLLQSLLFGLPILLVLAALGGYILMRRSLRPVERMIDAAEAITFNNPANRLPVAGTGDRIEMLALALNRMLDRLDNAYQYANRFSVDAAHELRTPLAIIRGELEFMASQQMPLDQREALKNTLSEVTRLSELVENLGLLSDIEGLWGKRARTEFDLYALATETIEQMRLLADEKGITLNPLSGSTAIVSGDRNRLKQVIVNLLDNAIKYTDPGGQVTVEIVVEGHRAGLIISDTGIGIALEHQEGVFRRFFRVSTDRGETGSGLGLAIARSICSAHGGSITVDSTPNQGSSFRVDLPLAAQFQPMRKRQPLVA